MVIYFLRHASAGESLSNPKKDEQRPLDRGGIEQCGYIGRALAAMDVHVDMIITSPLKRAAQTASLVGNELGYEGKLQFGDALRPAATFADFRKLLDKYTKYETIMVVGHNPSLSEFGGRSISEAGCEASVELKKGAVAKVDMDRNSAVFAVVHHAKDCVLSTRVQLIIRARKPRGSSSFLFLLPTFPGPHCRAFLRSVGWLVFRVHTYPSRLHCSTAPQIQGAG